MRRSLLTHCTLFLAVVFSQAAVAAELLPLNQTPTQAQSQTAATATSPELASAPAAHRKPTGTTQQLDYAANITSDVFGAKLFTGAFAREGSTQFNPNYAVAVGDKIQIRLWGAFEFDAPLTVDAQGNIFLPHSGPVAVLGVRNQDLQRLVDAAIGKVFKSNVFSYASLAAAQPVRVFVSGFVNRPGLYSGTSMDSLLHYLDQAGGIDPERGSFLNVQVKRGPLVRATINLYDFLLEGTMPLTQLSNGDVIFVTPRQNTVRVSGLAANAKRFEFSGNRSTVADLIAITKPTAAATHVRVLRNTGTVQNTEYYPLQDAASVALQNGDELAFTADKRPGTITVRVEGEHQSPQEYVLPYGTRMGALLPLIKYSERSDKNSLQLFRISVKERQKRLLQASLKSLETAALTARSGTSDEAKLRKEEAELLLQWVERAKAIEPIGQVVIAQSSTETRNNLLLENGDIFRVPTLDGLVLISGEVLFPSTVTHDTSFKLDDYVNRAGGYTQNAETARLVVARRDGSFAEVMGQPSFFSFGPADIDIRAGDQILVLPKIDVKSRQIWKDLTQIIFQLAVSAKVVLGL